MPTQPTPLLGLALPANGELDGTWGDAVNNSITSLLDSAVAGTTTLSADVDVTLTDTTFVANQARQAVILWNATSAVTRNITAPAQSKPYIVINAGTNSVVLRGVGPTTGITIVSGERCLAAWNGSDFVKVATSVVDGVSTFSGGTTGLTPNTATSGAVTLAGILAVANGGTGTATPALAQGANVTITGTWPNQTISATAPGTGTVTSVGGTGTVNGISLSGTVTSTGNLTLGGALSGVDLTTQVTGTLPVANGGTGNTTAQAEMNRVAAAVTSGQYLRGNGTNVVMSAIQAADVPTLNQNTTGTAANVTGTVAVANGGTGATSLTANNVVIGNGTSAPLFVAPGGNGNVLTSTGTGWISSAPSGGGLIFIVKTANYTAVAGESILADTSGGSFTITLPAAPFAGASISIKDSARTFSTNPLLVARNGNTIMGLAENMFASINGAFLTLIYNGSTWRIA